MRMEHTKWNGLFEGVIKAYLRFIWERKRNGEKTLSSVYW